MNTLVGVMKRTVGAICNRELFQIRTISLQTVGAICNRESGNQIHQFAITNRSYTDTNTGGSH